MAKKVQANKRSVIFTWLLSYIAFLFILLLINGITYMKTIKVIESQITESNKFLLNRVQQHMDNLLTGAQRMSTEIVFNAKVQKVAEFKKPIADEKYFDIYEAVRNLNIYKTSNSSLYDFFVYFNELDTVISPGNCFDSKTYFELNYNLQKISYRQWYEIIQSMHRAHFITFEGRTRSNSLSKDIAYIISMPMVGGEKLKANVAVIIDGSKFVDEAMGMVNINKGSVFIIDKDNRVIAASSPIKLTQTITYDTMEGENGTLYSKIGNEKVVVSYINSGISDWKYVSVIPRSIFWEKAVYSRKINTYSIIISLLIGIILTIFFLRRDYNPIEGLLRMFDGQQGLIRNKTGNEYAFIEQAISKTLDEKEQIAERLEKQDKILKSNFLERLIKGKNFGHIPIDETLSSYNINFISNYFAVMLFYVINNNNERFTEKGYTLEDIYEILIDAVIGEMSRKNKVYMVEVDGTMACLINLSPDEKAGFKEYSGDFAQHIKSYMNEKYNVNFAITISAIHETPSAISQAYEEALQVMEYKKVLGIRQCLHFEDIKFMPQASYYYPLEKEQQLINLMRSGDYDGAKIVLNEVFEKNFSDIHLSIELSKCLMFNLVSTMIKAINELGKVCETNFLENFNPVNRLIKCNNLEDLKNELMDILQKFCIEVQNVNKSDSRKFNNDIVKFIMKNYTNENLNISMIAEHFNMHPVYVSRAFKDYVGEGILDYINKARINKAKELLKDKNQTIESVAKAVGYSNTKTFTRAFKKYEGITPGKYREAYC